MNWRSQAACADMSTSLFFPSGFQWQRAEATRATELADGVCGGCPVRDDCFIDACATDSEGVWAATTTADRRALMALRPAARERLAELQRAGAMDMAREAHERNGPELADVDGLTIPEVATALQVSYMAARRVLRSGPSRRPMSRKLVLDELEVGQTRDRQELIAAVAAQLPPHKEYRSRHHAARGAVYRLEVDGVLAKDRDAGTVTLRYLPAYYSRGADPVCAVCGVTFVADDPRQLTCSDVCRQRRKVAVEAERKRRKRRTDAAFRARERHQRQARQEQGQDEAAAS